MYFKPTPHEIAAMHMVNAALPQRSTPPRIDRITSFEKAEIKLNNFHDFILNDNEKEIRYSAIIPLGIYATREALSSLVHTDKVDRSLSGRVSDELQKFSTKVHEKVDYKKPKNGHIFGVVAELATANMIWTGIASEELSLDYAVLMGRSGFEKSNCGLKKDNDITIHTIEPNKPTRKKLQIKASSKRASAIYDDSIFLVTVQSLFTNKSPKEAVSTLLNWENVDDISKNRVYDKFSNMVEIKNI